MLTLLAAFILFSGFYVLYNTSKKAELNKLTIVIWLQRHLRFSKIIGLAFLVISFYLFTINYGFGAGVFIALVLLMMVSSLVIILFPLNKEGKL